LSEHLNADNIDPFFIFFSDRMQSSLGIQCQDS
jgi:hypothetical protein